MAHGIVYQRHLKRLGEKDAMGALEIRLRQEDPEVRMRVIPADQSLPGRLAMGPDAVDIPPREREVHGILFQRFDGHGLVDRHVPGLLPRVESDVAEQEATCLVWQGLRGVLVNRPRTRRGA